jgi:hypothetical protein
MHGGQHSADRDDLFRRLRVGAALVLLGIGIAMALWAFGGAYRIFTEPQRIEVFQAIVPENPDLRTLEIDGEEIVLPEGLFKFMAYVIGCLLLLIAGSIGGGFISGGVNLLQSNIARLESRMTKKVEGLGAKLEDIAERLNQKSRQA